MWVLRSTSSVCGILMVLTSVIAKPQLVISRVDYGDVVDVNTTPAPAIRSVDPLQYTSFSALAEVTRRYSHTTVNAGLRNPADHAQQATFTLLLPETAYISNFTMVLDGISYVAYVKEKEEAKAIFDEAVRQGQGAGTVAVQARDSNQFNVSVNVEPYTTAEFILSYEELLARKNGAYSININVNPGQVVPDLTVTVHIREDVALSLLRVPELQTGNEVTPAVDDPQNSLAEILTKGNGEATITFSPDAEQQKLLMEIYANKSRESEQQFQQRFNGDRTQVQGSIGQFVVLYDVEHYSDGEVLVSYDGYFVHFFAPPDLPTLSKHVVFVLDTSGSMTGRKIEQLRQAMASILAELREGDFFQIVEFASTTLVHDINDVNQTKSNDFRFDENTNVTLLAASPVNTENIKKAQAIVSKLEADGGTNIAQAMSTGVALCKRGVDTTNSSYNTGITSRPDCCAGIDVPELQPIIIFLTDGEPTSGETNKTKIVNSISQQNIGINKAAIFCLAFGDDADQQFLRKLALRNDGFSRKIYEAADAALQLKDFFSQVSSPQLADVQFIYPQNQVVQGSVTTSKFDAFYFNSELIVAGQVTFLNGPFQPQVTAVGAVDGSYQKVPFRCYPYPIFPPEVNQDPAELRPLERLWAYLTVKQLLDARDAADGDDTPGAQEKRNATEKQALALALKYSFVTELTSLVVVKPNGTTTVDAHSVDKPSNDFGGGFASSTIGTAAFFPSSGRPGQPGQAGALGPPGKPGTPLKFPGPMQGPPSLPPPSPVLIDYYLTQYPWIEDYINTSTDSVELPINGTIVTLLLSKNQGIQFSAPGAQCTSTINGNSGECTYLPQCDAAKSITIEEYKKAYCSIDMYAGVCCPYPTPKTQP